MKIKNILITSVLASSLMSCSDFLELDPTDKVTADTYFNTSDDAYRALIGSYQKMMSTYEIGANYMQTEMATNVMSDDLYVGGANAGDWSDLHRANTFSSRPTDALGLNIWAKCYEGIQRANTLLVNYDKITFKSNVAEEANKVNYKAEAIFLRGHYYFELVRAFENVVLTTVPMTGSDWSNAVQAAPDQVYTQIASDMYSSLPGLKTSLASSELGRITKYAAEAELAKAWLFYTGYYNKTEMPLAGVAGKTSLTKADIAELLQDIIDNGGFSLMPNYSDLWTTAGEFCNEVVFEIPYGDHGWGAWGSEVNSGNYVMNLNGPDGYAGTSTLSNGWGFNPPTHAIVEAFEAGDARLAASVITSQKLVDDGGIYNVRYQNTGYFTFKYYPKKEFQAPVENMLNWMQNYHYIRYADVLLMAAEVNLGVDNAKAKGFVDEVRARAGLAPVSTVTLDVIYKERRVELAFEGHRYYDLIRRGLDYAESNLNVTNYTLYPPMSTAAKYVSNKGFNATGDVGVAADYEVKFDKSKRGFLPIPQNEIDLNPSLKQNPGYN